MGMAMPRNLSARRSLRTWGKRLVLCFNRRKLQATIKQQQIAARAESRVVCENALFSVLLHELKHFTDHLFYTPETSHLTSFFHFQT